MNEDYFLRFSEGVAKKTTIKCLDGLGKDFDSKLKEWQSSTSLLSADIPLTSTPVRNIPPSMVSPCGKDFQSPLAPSFSFVEESTQQSMSTSTVITDDSISDLVPDPSIEVVPDTSSKWFGYKIVGDNVDGMIKPRNMRSDNQLKDFHYFQ